MAEREELLDSVAGVVRDCEGLVLTLVARDGVGKALEAGDRDADFELVGETEGQGSAVWDLRGLSDALGELEMDAPGLSVREEDLL